MKLKENFALRQVAGTWVVLPLAEECLDFNRMLTLNETGAVLWRLLEQGGSLEAMVNALTAEYAVDRATALSDADEFLEKLTQIGCLEKK